MKRLLINLDDLRERYLEGVSEKALAERYGVSRSVIARRLNELGIERRGRSAAMFARMAATDSEERQRLVSAAHAARRGHPSSEEELARRALARESSTAFTSPRELVLLALLRERGTDARGQVAVGRYNLDLAIDGQVAVELHRTSSNPARSPRTRQRAHYLLDRGWSVIYVWVNASFVMNGRGADKVVAFAHEAQRLPAGARQYRVVRGSGEHVLSIRFDRDEAAAIPPPKAHQRTRRDHER